jgi:hypothetical protein
MKTRVRYTDQLPTIRTLKAGQLVVLKDDYYSERHSESPNPHICLVLEDEGEDGNFTGVRLQYSTDSVKNAYSKNWHANCWELFRGELILSNEEE